MKRLSIDLATCNRHYFKRDELIMNEYEYRQMQKEEVKKTDKNK